MHNFFAMEVEAELMRQERERAAAADARAAQARPANGNRRWVSLASQALGKLPTLALPTVPVAAPLQLRRVPRPVDC